MNDWIGVKDELPEFHKPLLFHVKGNGLGVMCGAFYAGNHKFISFGKYTEARFHKSDVTHWQYLPEPPQ